jgi:hypothetical protein
MVGHRVNVLAYYLPVYEGGEHLWQCFLVVNGPVCNLFLLQSNGKEVEIAMGS